MKFFKNTEILRRKGFAKFGTWVRSQMIEWSNLWGWSAAPEVSPFPAQLTIFMKNQGFSLTGTRQTLKRDHGGGKTQADRTANRS